MNPISLLLFVLGGLVQIVGIAYAAVGFDSLNVPLLIGAIVVGSLLEFGGIVLHGASRM